MGGTAQRRRKGTDTTYSTSKPTDDGLLKFEGPSQQLLSGIPDHLTESLIIPKLSLGRLCFLSMVSRPWNQQFQIRLDARLCLLATETEVVISSKTDGKRLCSLKDGFSYHLPPIPNAGTRYASWGFPQACDFIFMGGKVYYLEGKHYEGNGYLPHHELYVMDLVGHRQWQQCKSLQYARWWKGCLMTSGVYGVRGKIYALGGFDFWDTTIDVYDPESNTWDRIMVPEILTPYDMVPGLQEAEMTRRNLLCKVHSSRASLVPFHFA